MKTFKKIALFFVLPLAVAAMTSSYAGSSSASGDPVCPADDEYVTLLPHETNCSLFYKCELGVPVLKKCQDGLHFNPTLNVCDYPKDDENCDSDKTKCWNSIRKAEGQAVDYCGSPCPMRIEESEPSYWANYVDC